MNKLKVGSRVTIISSNDPGWYRAGDKGTIVRKSSDGKSWQVQLDSPYRSRDGKWWVREKHLTGVGGLA